MAGFFAGAWVSHRLPEPERVSQVVMWWVLTIATATAAATLVDRVARSFLPLSTLLKMSMLFPDEAPSRLRVARRSGSMSELKRRVAEVKSGGDRATAEAAELILSLSAALGRHDRKTRGHSERVRAYVDMVAEQLGLGQGDRDRLRWAALLHDIGKLEISGEILNKDGALDEDEWHEVRQHPIHGLRMIAPIAAWLGPWAETIAHHHERFDGSGYPFGLAGEDIAYGARIVAVADAYDVMTSGRSYQRAMSANQARREIVEMSGTQFDPKVARALMRVAIGRLRWATGPLAAIGQFPWSRGLPALGRDVVTLAASSAIMTTSLVTGVVPSPADLPTQEVVEVVIAGAGLSGGVVDAIIAAGAPETEDPTD
ncbi:MAG: HD-GYP domain-containing protein, partial [Acidimicrobiia bacterium]|nr:HD-GYP domain-containing protein [Acidimicrobiia bacterium]